MGIYSVFQRKDSNWKLKILVIWNLIAFVYYFTATSITTYLVLFEIIPFIFGEIASSVLKHDIIMCYFLLQIVGNWLLVITTDSSIHSLPSVWNKSQKRNLSTLKMSKEQNKDSDKTKIHNHMRKRKDCNVTKTNHCLKERKTERCHSHDSKESDAAMCDSCNILVPQRSHHCSLCNDCILKRDHHCFFMCTCIGFHNQKYFVLWCFYMFIASFYSLTIIAMYLKKYFNISFGLFTLLTLLPNTLHEWWFQSLVTPYQLLVVGVFYMCLTCGLAAAGFFYWQLYIVSQGQTSYEALKGILTYSSDEVLHNFKDVFGPYWYISLFLPLYLPSSGLGIY